MKKKFILPIVLLSVIGLVLLNIFTAGDKHVEVVGENVSLTNQVTTLKSENSNLKSLNADLTKKNQELTNQQYHFNHGKTHGFEQAKSVYDPQVNLLQNILKLTNEFNQQNPPLT